MATVERSSVGSGNFWGLVQQKGPWKSTPADKRNASLSLKNRSIMSGGGIGAGGTRHAGNGNWASTTTPADRDAWKAPPPPSKYATRSIMTPAGYSRKPVAGGIRGAPTPMSLGRMKPDDVGKAGMPGFVPPLGGYPKEGEGYRLGSGDSGDESSGDEEMSITPVDQKPTPSSFGMSEHRMEEAMKQAETVDVKEEKMDVDDKVVETLPYTGGVKRRGGPLQKVRRNPIGKKEMKSMTKDEKGPQGNYLKSILEYLMPVKQETKPTPFVPPKYNQVTETAKASTIKSPAVTATVPGAFPSASSGPATEVLEIPGKKRKSENESAVKKEKLMAKPRPLRIKYKPSKQEEVKRGPVPQIVAPRGTKRKSEKENTERMKKGRLMVPQKRVKPSLKVETRNLPPSAQSSTKAKGVRYERKSAPGKESNIPDRTLRPR